MSHSSIPDNVVVLTFDDAVSSHATFVAPLLRELGFGATFYIAEYFDEKKPADNFATDKHQYLTWEQIAGLHTAGFEVGNHTLHHVLVDQVSRGEVATEIELIEQRCASYGIPRPTTFAYPCGNESEWAHEVLREKGYRYARACGDRAYRPGVDSPLSVPSYVIHAQQEALFYQALETRQPDEVIVYTFHGVPDFNHPWVDTPPVMFEKMMRHLHARGLRGVAMRDLVEGGCR